MNLSRDDGVHGMIGYDREYEICDTTEAMALTIGYALVNI